ncbi:DNA repair protein RadA [Kordiimonas sp. SCSIO 12610]|uniref:DNA repair protein RadA n=1 Tax=Kordiimonas sp. SCSIO 12610 TaxID=2829597 RepID=UPI00210ECE95|nr:DNA repair protein RadA [Kordiimonas sp. SCSIO 12610]UTW54098.1 DNA repair protein RadA [Kordiimonas sp. SCSIO 12610]
MAKQTKSFVCSNCGSVYSKWQGKCDDCGEWNTLEEEQASVSGSPKGLSKKKGRTVDLVSLDTPPVEAPRILTGVGEFDRALGGGLVPGSAILIGGDPGIGKSTILLQALGKLAQKGEDCIYFSGEEATAQVQMRAKRLGLTGAPLRLGCETSLRDILTTLDSGKPPKVVVIDSIQTLFADHVDSAPGTVTQVRVCAHELISYAKRKGTVMLIVGHVTKDGQIAGPRVLEHMVDTVLYFEGDRGHQFRILRAVKNRFGGTDEIGVFEMTGGGLSEVTNPSELFLSDHNSQEPGSAVFAGLEGSRPVLVEIQALVARTSAANPRRAVVGWDSGRLAMVLAVLDARAGLGLAGCDVYLNVAGGLKISEPAADMAVAAALVSSLAQVSMPEETVIFGEISLSGDTRGAAQSEARLKEASKLGFAKAIVPKGKKSITSDIKQEHIAKVSDLVAIFIPDQLD